MLPQNNFGNLPKYRPALCTGCAVFLRWWRRAIYHRLAWIKKPEKLDFLWIFCQLFCIMERRSLWEAWHCDACFRLWRILCLFMVCTRGPHLLFFQAHPVKTNRFALRRVPPPNIPRKEEPASLPLDEGAGASVNNATAMIRKGRYSVCVQRLWEQGLWEPFWAPTSPRPAAR